MSEQLLATFAEIEALCIRFGIPYDKATPRDSLEQVLEAVLDDLSDPEFASLGTKTIRRLTQLGESATNGTLHVDSRDNRPRPQSVRLETLRLIKKGYTIAEVVKEFEQSDTDWSRTHVISYAAKHRSREMAPKPKPETTRHIVLGIMNGGKGLINTTEILAEVERRKKEKTMPKYKKSYILSLIFAERKRLGLTRMATNKILEQRIEDSL